MSRSKNTLDRAQPETLNLEIMKLENLIHRVRVYLSTEIDDVKFIRVSELPYIVYD